MTSGVSNHYRLRGRRILLGITAGVAAYKAAELARLLVGQGAEVRVVMTPSAHEFIGAHTLQAITGQPVRDQLFDSAHEAAMGHIELACWAELVLVAPATADFLAKLRGGFADTLLSTLCLATDAPIALAPAMNRLMWANPATVENVRVVGERGIMLWGPAAGEQACGEVGPGRLLEPTQLLAHCVAVFAGSRFAGKRVVLTAGPTHEPLDPVRYLGNRSSGKMGYALAQALLREGAQVTLITGPVDLAVPAGVDCVPVQTAVEMHTAALQAASGADLFIACAAVADYRPVTAAEQKIKKSNERLQVDLLRNPDILRDVAALADAPFCVGFSAETQDLEASAKAKLKAKKVQMIAANRVDGGRAFGRDDNELLVVWEGGSSVLPLQPKGRLAEQLISMIADRLDAQTANESA